MSTRGTHGFSLLEALVALALMGVLLGALAAVTGQWIPGWSHGFGRLQRRETLDLVIQRVVEDLAAARFVTAKSATAPALFRGDSDNVAFVRSAIGPDAGPSLEWVRYAVEDGALTRARAAYAPVDGTPAPDYRDPVAILRAPWRLRFAFAGADGVWTETWSDRALLPARVRIEAFDASTGAALAGSTMAPLRVDAPAPCAVVVSVDACLKQRGAP